jgi:ATP-binding cassette, subfamily B, bacterial
MVFRVIKYYYGIAMSQKKYSLPPLFLAPIARIGNDYLPTLVLSVIINRVSGTELPEVSSLVWLVALYWIIPTCAEAIWRILIWFMNKNDAYGMQKIANRTFSDLMNRSYDFHINNFAGSLVAKTNRFVSAYEPLYDMLVFEVMGTLTGLVFAVVVVMRISWQVGVAFLVTLAIYLVIMYKLTKKRFQYNTERAAQESIQTGQLADSLTNAITTKTFSRERHEFKLFADISKVLASKRLRSWNYQNVPMDVLTTNMINAMRLVALIGALYATYRYGIAIGSVFLVLTYVNTLTGKFWELARLMRNIESNISNAVEMMEILSQERLVLDESGAPSLKTKSGSISINNVSFSYEKSDKKSGLFTALNLEIPHGQSVGLVGPSGGGKTTITKLLLRFMDVREGEILIDGQNIAKVSQNSLRDVITYVPQEPLLFHRSLRENIAYGRPSATEKQIIDAAKKAHAHEFILSLPKGYDTLVGERGIKLSGGQRQRVALARSILKDAPIIVLDEATSALDSESEKLIQDALFKLMENRTTIVIAHRLSTIKHLDRILVLEDGKITEDGDHETLSKKKDGTYARLWAHQSGGFIE